MTGPNSGWVRIPVGVLFILGSVFWYPPVVGIELLPIGLLLIAQDVPFSKKPVGRFSIWLERKRVSLRKRWRQRHEHQPP